MKTYMAMMLYNKYNGTYFNIKRFLIHKPSKVMKNNFQQWQDAEENRFHEFDEIENNLVKQVETFSFFGKVIELKI